ncbi:hypothetical protein ZWY2020_035596 [Hordeum vulgare]|nr:hypothetical protein ZWY2020_035596 [Hordeum vulgare]
MGNCFGCHIVSCHYADHMATVCTRCGFKDYTRSRAIARVVGSVLFACRNRHHGKVSCKTPWRSTSESPPLTYPFGEKDRGLSRQNYRS